MTYSGSAMCAPVEAGALGDLPVTYSQPVVGHWSVVFMSGRRESLWDWLTDPDYRHVCCYGWVNDRWVLIDPAHGRLFATSLDQAGLETWLKDNAFRITSVVKIEARNGVSLHTRLGLWCTSVVAYCIGRGVGAFTPKGLKRVLLRHGAVEL